MYTVQGTVGKKSLDEILEMENESQARDVLSHFTIALLISPEPFRVTLYKDGVVIVTEEGDGYPV